MKRLASVTIVAILILLSAALLGCADRYDSMIDGHTESTPGANVYTISDTTIKISETGNTFILHLDSEPGKKWYLMSDARVAFKDVRHSYEEGYEQWIFTIKDGAFSGATVVMAHANSSEDVTVTGNIFHVVP